MFAFRNIVDRYTIADSSFAHPKLEKAFWIAKINCLIDLGGLWKQNLVRIAGLLSDRINFTGR